MFEEVELSEGEMTCAFWHQRDILHIQGMLFLFFYCPE